MIANSTVWTSSGHANPVGSGTRRIRPPARTASPITARRQDGVRGTGLEDERGHAGQMGIGLHPTTLPVALRRLGPFRSDRLVLMDLEWKETEMEALNLADNALKGLKPDPAWDVSGVRRHGRRRDRRRARIVRGRDRHRLRQPHPGLVSDNQMERAFSWKRLLAAMLVLFAIGAAVSGWGWSCNVFGSNGLGVNRSYTQASGSGKPT